jgi:hypothetical protein
VVAEPIQLFFPPKWGITNDLPRGRVFGLETDDNPMAQATLL